MPEKIAAAGGVVFKILEEKVSILLIYRNRSWDLPKGKLEENESIPMCAAREVAEETGSTIPMILSSLGTTYHEYDQKSIHYGKTTFWYSMIFTQDQELTPQVEEGIESINWVELGEAIHKVGFDNLKEVLGRFKNWMA